MVNTYHYTLNMIKIATLAFNPFGENTYIIFDSTTKQCIIVDAGCCNEKEQQTLVSFIDKNELRPILALNTHAHIDHVCGVEFVKSKWGVEFALHAQDLPLLEAVPSYAQSMGFRVDTVPVVEVDLSDGMELKLGQSTIRIIHTPGHTPGHVSVYLPEEKTLLTGDTLFKESIGRTDLPGGDYPTLMRSIFEKIVPLGGDTTVFPGHGPKTDLAHEMMYNPFLTEAVNGEINYK